MENNDLISRQAVINALEEWEAHWTWDGWCYENKGESGKHHIVSPTSVIAALPSKNPEMVEWKRDGTCPFCGKGSPYYQMGAVVYRSSYCPNCGSPIKKVDLFRYKNN